jgi:hypothetical protein
MQRLPKSSRLTLHDEMRDDCRVVSDALEKAIDRFARHDDIGNEACAHQLCRRYGRQVRTVLPRLVEEFIQAVAREQKISRR